MCGLLLTTSPREPGDPGWDAAMDVLSCRGPDARGEVHGGHATAGQQRLEIIGLGSAGRQPYTLDPAVDLLVYNGEIYNYRELAAGLGIEADSDTHVLYHLLSTGQEHRLGDLRGMYAFAYWRHDRVLTGRDPFGIKPLYTTIDEQGGLVAASVPAAITALHRGSVADPAAIAGFLASGLFPAGWSAFGGVHKHEPGVLLTWTRTGGGWEAAATPIDDATSPRMEVPAALADSVAAHLVSDVPVGVLLSGGVDSTLIASLAAERVPGLQSFSLVNPAAPTIDEAAYAAWNARLLGTRHREVPFDPSAALMLTREIVATSGEPFGDAAFLPLATLCREVRRHVKVVLAGEGADELFAGYRRYDVERPRQGGITAPLAGVAGRIAGGKRRYDRGEPSMRTRTLASWAEADPHLAHSYLLSGEWPVVAASPRGAEALRVHRARWGNATRPGLPAYRAYDLHEWLPNVFLEKSDRASMLASVEVRVPFLDPVVAASARGLDPRDSLKRPLRDLLLQRHPTVRLPARKMGLSVDLPALLTRSGLADYADSALHDDGSVLRLEGMPDPVALARRARANPALAFRLATVGVWQDVMAPRVG